MTVDTYFCYCCLSTDDLVTLFGNNETDDYSQMLQEFFFIKVSRQQDCDGYICETCAAKLTDAKLFKTLVHETIKVLQLNGLLKTRRGKGGYLLVKNLKTDEKDSEEQETKTESEDSRLSDELEAKILCDHTSSDTPKDTIVEKQHDIVLNHIKAEPKAFKDEPPDTLEAVDSVNRAVKQECIETAMLRDVEIVEGKELLEELLRTVPKLPLEREKRITVTKRKKTAKNVKKVRHDKTPLYNINDDLKCEHCGIVLPNLRMFHLHMNVHFPNHVCETCGKGFLSIKRLKRHVPSHEKGPFNCASCEAVFTNYNSLNSHRQRKHGNVKLYKCTVCDERFLTFHRRMIHLAEVHGQNEKKYKCTMCPMEFLVSGNLSSHIRRTHLSVKRYFCNVCKIGFFDKQELQSHAPSHTGVKAFQCSVCLKSYPRKKTLAVHMRIHTNDKRFSCDVCLRKFTQKCTLQCHLKVHEKEKQRVQVEMDGPCYEYTYV